MTLTYLALERCVCGHHAARHSGPCLVSTLELRGRRVRCSCPGHRPAVQPVVSTAGWDPGAA